MSRDGELSRVESFEVIPYALPFRRPYVTAKGTLDRREMALLRIRTRSGAVGLGEAVPLSLRGGQSLAEVVRLLEAWGASAVESTGPAGAAAAGSAPGGPAGCAVATALADAAARERSIPLHRLLGERWGRTGVDPGRGVRCNATLTAGSPTEVAAQAEEWARDGFRTFKLKLGPEGDRGQVEALRLALGPDARIRVDVNATWTVDQAVEQLGRLAPFGLELIEQPVDGLAAMAALKRRCEIPLVADEAVTGPDEAAEAARLEAADAVTVKLSKIGGLDAGLGGHLPTYLSSALDGPVGIAAAAHVAAALAPTPPWDDVDHGLATERLFAATVAEQGPLLAGSRLPPPPGPGLGVTLDDAALRLHRL